MTTVPPDVPSDATAGVAYRSRPSECRAMRWNGSPGWARVITEWCVGEGGEAFHREAPSHANPTRRNSIGVNTINGWSYAVPGDYVVQQLGEWFVLDPETFERRWEPVR